jgi:Arc/MetJ family transcription regulator
VLLEARSELAAGDLRLLYLGWLLKVGIQGIGITAGGTKMTMVKTPVEIDQEALALAAEVLGTKTKKGTVNAALREVGQRLDRLRALARLREMADQGDFDEFIGNKAAYRR